MQSYRLSTNLKSGLVLFAALIAVASLAYTSRIVEQLRAREYTVIQLWADALVEITKTQSSAVNPYQPDFHEMMQFIDQVGTGNLDVLPSRAQLGRFKEAILWAQSMPPAGEASFIANALVIRDDFTIPSILSDSIRPISWRDLPVAETFETSEDSITAYATLDNYRREMDAINAPIPIRVTSEPLGELRNWVHFGESKLIRELRIFPYAQLLFVGLFILVGYLGFSYVRRSEQSSLWVGMAKEAAHQLGTPISSLMGWAEIMKTPNPPAETQLSVVAEVENDIARLQRVANRFSNIGSRPKLKPEPLEPVIESMVDYMRQRMPKHGKKIELVADLNAPVAVPLNTELFEWVIENLIKNALDAIDVDEGVIRIHAYLSGDKVLVDFEDNGKGIDRRHWKNIFRPGYSTKKRGWGLGLSLAKRIVEDYHGGKLLLAQSKVSEGSTFRIVLSEIAN